MLVTIALQALGTGRLNRGTDANCEDFSQWAPMLKCRAFGDWHGLQQSRSHLRLEVGHAGSNRSKIISSGLKLDSLGCIVHQPAKRQWMLS